MGLVYITPFTRDGITEFVEVGTSIEGSFASVTSSKIIEAYTATPDQNRLKARFINPQTLEFGSPVIIEEDFSHGGISPRGDDTYVTLVNSTRAVVVTFATYNSVILAILLDVSGTTPVVLHSITFSSLTVPYAIVGCNDKATVFHYRNSPVGLFASLITYNSGTETISVGTATTMSTATSSRIDNAVLVNPTTGYSLVAWKTTSGYVTSFNNTTLLANRSDQQYYATSVQNIEGHVVTLNSPSQGMILFRYGDDIGARRLDINEGSALTFGNTTITSASVSFHDSFRINDDRSVMFYSSTADSKTYYQIFDKSSGEVLLHGSPVLISPSAGIVNMNGINLGDDDLLIRHTSGADTIYYKFTY